MPRGRKLIYVPILHTEVDMGNLSGSMQAMYQEKFGKRQWQEDMRALDEMWHGLKKKIQALQLPYGRLKVYQDGLPLCGKEEEIVKDLAKKGSRNHQILWWLRNRGGRLVGTEDPNLLLQDYQHLRDIVQSKNGGEREKKIKEFEKIAPGLLHARDEFIRSRIAETLGQGETGVLFIGLLHRVDELLPQDMQVQYLIHRLPFHRSFEMEMAI